MRNLTIKRNKTGVACLAKMKIYVEDRVTPETDINDVPCRKLGDLKNGEEKTFVISNEEVRVFAIADNLSKSYCNDYYKVPAGSEDVYLSGKNRYNPFKGNPFYFDGVTDEEVLKNRKKGSKIGVLVSILAIIAGFAIGFAIAWI